MTTHHTTPIPTIDDDEGPVIGAFVEIYGYASRARTELESFPVESRMLTVPALQAAAVRRCAELGAHPDDVALWIVRRVEG